MQYRCYFKSFDGTEYMKVLSDPDFDALRSKLHPQFLYADERPTTPEGMVDITLDTTVRKYDHHAPRHARGRRTLTLSCKHVVYADQGVDPEECYICKAPIFTGRCFYCDGKLVDYKGMVGYVWCERCQTDYDPRYLPDDDYDPDEDDDIIPAGMEDADLYQVW